MLNLAKQRVKYVNFALPYSRVANHTQPLSTIALPDTQVISKEREQSLALLKKLRMPPLSPRKPAAAFTPR